MGPLVGTRLYPVSEGPYWEKGMGVCAGAMVAVAVLAGGLRGYLRWRNGRLEKRKGGYEGVGQDDDEEVGLVGGGGRGWGRREGDGFRYML